MDESYKRHSRRSHPNLQLFSVKPLTSLPLDTDVDNHERQHSNASSSYLASRSLPQTPSILSRSNSRSRSGHKVGSKSSHTISALNEAPTTTTVKTSHSRRPSGTRNSRTKASDNKDWLVQTASALAITSAEYKGQAWLATRSSSISLANAINEPPESAYRADDEYSPISLKQNSRAQSRYGSRLGSRRNSKVGLMTPMGMRTPGERDGQAGYFDDMSVDFVESDSEEGAGVEDENEVRKLVTRRVGGWVDWAVGWMDFRGDDDEDPEESRDIDDAQARPGGALRRPSPAQHVDVDGDGANAPPAAQEGGGALGDAAWLFGIAKSILV